MHTIFATYAAHKNDLFSNFLLAHSIRDFAGDLSDAPMKIYVSSNLDVRDEMKRFDGLNVAFATYPYNKKRYRYAFKPAAAAACEMDVKEGNVVWLDRHMMVLSACTDLILNPSKNFAYRPPHLKILGASANEPIGDLWSMIFKIADDDVSKLFPIHTEVDNEKIWSYFSAGHFAFRAEARIMQAWDALFKQLVEHPDMQPFLEDETVRIYLHQIALTAAVLKTQTVETLMPLPALYGYPTHLHNKMTQDNQVPQMDQIHTAFFTKHGNTIPKKHISASLTSWLDEKMKLYKNKI
ncbi:MAG: hypothetical protein FWC71_06370 [Defluviitaleaceae bacterium]|nr:hypothetical protein [Defluviitaleaceae bacterium]